MSGSATDHFAHPRPTTLQEMARHQWHFVAPDRGQDPGENP